MSYSSNGNRPKLSEKGLLTPDNCRIMDLQPELFALRGSRTLPFFAEIEFSIGTLALSPLLPLFSPQLLEA
jgi:hypothetical protein